LSDLHFRAVAGDFKEMQGLWHLASAGTDRATHLTCDFAMQPRRNVPEWAVRFTARHYLKQMVAALADRARKVP
jgi:ribosome-associated toxin RatA of RatAB toxin-antitoxin module